MIIGQPRVSLALQEGAKPKRNIKESSEKMDTAWMQSAQLVQALESWVATSPIKGNKITMAPGCTWKKKNTWYPTCWQWEKFSSLSHTSVPQVCLMHISWSPRSLPGESIFWLKKNKKLLSNGDHLWRYVFHTGGANGNGEKELDLHSHCSSSVADEPLCDEKEMLKKLPK